MRTIITAYKLILVIILLSLAGIFILVHSPAPAPQPPTVRQIEPQEPSRGNRALIMEATAYSLEGGSESGLTTTGTIPQEGRTVAVDPKVIPYGTALIINGRAGYIAEDTGGAIKGDRLDIFMESREEALRWGRQTVKVEIKE